MTTDVQEAKKNLYIKWDRILTVNILTRFDYSLNDKTGANYLFNCILILAMLVLSDFFIVFSSLRLTDFVMLTVYFI